MTSSGTRRLWLLGPARVEQIHTAPSEAHEQGAGAPPRFRSRRTVGLLGYLVAERRPVAREFLAGLFWPDETYARGRTNLSRELHNLAQILPGCWELDRQAVAFVPSASTAVDLYQLLHLEAEERWAEAAELVGGEFLEGVTLNDNPEFGNWLLGERERWRARAETVLRRVIQGHTRRGRYTDALHGAQRLLQLAPWDEETHRQVMRLLVWTGQRGAALRQFESCKRALGEELDVEPAPETRALYRQIQAGRLDLPPQLPAFLIAEKARHAFEQPLFVARERELAQLNAFLDGALSGQGRVIFVTGGPGRGKTALLEAFARGAMEKHPNLLVASGNCNAYSGLGDPYLPFRDVMGMLTGDVEARWDAGAITRDHAQRLWAALPLVIQALLDHDPHLVDVFLPRAAFLSRATAAGYDSAPWLPRLREHVGGEGAGSWDVEQSHVFQQITDVLRTVAGEQPLLLILDDLQWADAASIGLLFHLGRRLADADSRILIACAYRPEEVALGRADPSTLRRAQDGAGSGQAQRHPLAKPLSEFKRTFGDVWVDLGPAEAAQGRRFVDALLDAEPNRLAEGFRDGLFQRTEGHPLFTVELLRAMREEGDLLKDEDGRWIEGPALDWELLPARVEAVIEERIDRLDPELQEIFAVASVEGEVFTAQVVAEMLTMPERAVLRRLSEDLARRHRLVREQEEVHIVQGRLSRYRFRHILFQKYLYQQLSSGERRLLHGDVATALEKLYEGQLDEMVVQLAHHWERAEVAKKAIEYLLQAGDQARLAYAHAEAIDYYERALVFLKELGKHRQAARTLMKLGLTYHTTFDFHRSRQTYDEGFASWQRAEEVQAAAGQPPAPHALRERLHDVITLGRAMQVVDQSSTQLLRQLFSGLVEQGPELDIVPDVARSWEVSEGGRKYVFHLRDDVRWSDGAPVTAGDFEYAWKRMLDLATESQRASLLYDVEGARAFHQGEVSDPDCVGVQALDEVTLAVELERPTGYFLHLLAQVDTCPLPRHVVERHSKTWTEVNNLVTNGPFRMEAWKRGESMVLVRNPEYHGRFSGNLERVELSLIPGLSVPLEIYEADGLDILDLLGFPPPDMDRVRQRHAGEYLSLPLLSTHYVGFDGSRPPFDDPGVRRALALAIDKETLADVVLKGYASPATDGFLPAGMPGHSPGIGLPYDPDRARQLLAEAGYPGGRGFPVVDGKAYHGVESTIEYLQAQWQENLGIEITLNTMEWARYLDRLYSELPHVLISGWGADYPDPDYFLRVGPFLIRRRWNKAYDRLVEEARRVTDQRERMKLYGQADRMLVQEAVIVPLTYGRSHFLVKPWVSKYPVSATGVRLWKDVIIEPH